MFKLREKEIRKRLQDYENLKKCHAELKVRHEKLKKRVKELEAQVEIIPILMETLEDLKLQIEELKQMLFGKPKKEDEDDDEDGDSESSQSELDKKPRNKNRYKRKRPKPDEVTETKKHEMDSCPDCETELRKRHFVIFWEEDIPLPDENTQLKEVIEHQVEKGWCHKCRKWHTAIPLPSAKVILGNKVKIFICYLSILLRISNHQIIHLLRNAYQFDISNGEIANILDKMGKRLNPEFERIKERLQKGRGVHMDETGWRKLYLWVMTSIDTNDVIYLAGKSRGNGNIDDLLGENFNGIRVNDGYPAYLNKPGIAQLCWAHSFRKIRELAKSKTLESHKKKYCKNAYASFSAIYENLRATIEEPFETTSRSNTKQSLMDQMRLWCQPNKLDPKKLKNLKKQFTDHWNMWFNCLDYENVPCDNNKAERMLRHFVIKRRISFGTKTDKTSHNFSVLASVLMSNWKKTEKNFFQTLAKLCGFC